MPKAFCLQSEKGLNKPFFFINFRLIGQKELVKTAVNVEILTVTAVISFCRQDTGWTKRVGKNG